MPANASEQFRCPHCGALYDVKYIRLPGPDTAAARCVVCKTTMKSWIARKRIPMFTLVKRGRGTEE